LADIRLGRRSLRRSSWKQKPAQMPVTPNDPSDRPPPSEPTHEPETDPPQELRVLLVARHPLRSSDLGLDEAEGISVVGLVRRPDLVAGAIADTRPDVVIVDTSLAHHEADPVIERIHDDDPEIHVLALTPNPPPSEQVVRAVRAGAVGFIHVDLEPGEAETAIRGVCEHGTWFDSAQVVGVLSNMAPRARRDVERSAVAACRSGLRARAVGGCTGRPAVVAVAALPRPDRRPAGRPGDRSRLACRRRRLLDPHDDRVLRTPPVRRPLDREAPSRIGRNGAFDAVLRRRWLVWLTLTVGVIGIGLFLFFYADLVLVLFVGPAVTIALLGAVLDLQSELPKVMRLRKRDVRRFAIGGTVVAFALLFVLGGEALLRGPGFDTRGVNGLLMHRLIGFRAQPVLHTDVGGDGATREVLHLGGNADLYVFVDPCNDNEIDFVSVGSSRLENIDTVTCPTP
jgi:DNA-binding NarL/FixJ family response regulator